MKLVKFYFFILVLASFICNLGCENRPEEKKYEWTAIEVIASAYNSVSWQTDDQPNLAAWGDTLKPGMKVIAVSRDLLKMGLEYNTMVKIDTFPDTFYVKDKMHWKWRKKIDIYMGDDVQRAKEWGRKKVMICYAIPIIDTINNNTK